MPITTTCLPAAEAAETRRCIRATFGQVASVISAPAARRASSHSAETPWERIMTLFPGLTSSGEEMTVSPRSESERTTSSL